MSPEHAYNPQVPPRLRQRGFGLPAAIFIITVLALMVVALNSLDEVSSVSFVQDINSQRAFYAAESGAQIGLNRLFPAGAPASTCANGYFAGVSLDFTALGTTGLDNCSVRVSCAVDTVGGSNYYTLDSVGQCGGGADLAVRRLRVRAKQ